MRLGRTRATRYARSRSVRGLAVEIPIRRIHPDGSAVRMGSLWPLAARRHLWLRDGEEILFEGIPPFVDDMRPQGFLGRRFAERYPELELPSRLQDWSADDTLWALSQRGEDTVGDLILGDASFDRWLGSSPQATARARYPQLAREVVLHGAGSSAGGEHPKFAVWTGERHLLVKYAGRAEDGPSALRWKDLLGCEAIALDVLREAGHLACKACWVDVEGMRFLEVERFDRIGARGRVGVVSLGAWANEFLGTHRSWTSAAGEMESLEQLSAADSERIRWLDVFGALIANTDRHLWNLSFLWDTVGKPALAPGYDMLPMLYAPGPEGVIDRPFEPRGPTSATVGVWPEAARWAATFWERVTRAEEISAPFREEAARCGERVEAMRAGLAHLVPGSGRLS